MAGEHLAAVWEELGKVDYLLDQLARAVERGEVAPEVYERLAPRYLERRSDLAKAIDAAAQAPIAVAPATQPVASTPVAVPPAFVPPPAVRVARKPVQWTTVLTMTGAFLVIVAAAIFAIATWDLFPLTFRLAFLGVLTAGFYGAGWFVRSRLDLAAGGVALIAVGSAMLLFDGWIAIQGYRLAGPWPWVVWLAVCSAAYWFTEVRVGGRFFGVTGAAAQIAWWWLFAEGLGWSTAPRYAGIAVVGLVWTLAARQVTRAKQDAAGPFTTLAMVLKWAAPVAIGLSAFALLQDAAIGFGGWTEVWSALVVGVAATAVFEWSGFPRGVAATAHIPLLVAFLSMLDGREYIWWDVAFLVALAIGYALFELWRGGWGHGLLAFGSEFGAWVALAGVLDWSPDVVVALLIAVGGSWILASHLLESKTVGLAAGQAVSYPGLQPLATMARNLGFAVLALFTLAIPLAHGAVPLAGQAFGGREVALTAFAFAMWFAVAYVKHNAYGMLAAIAVSLYMVAAALNWLVPAQHSAVYATALLVVVAVWLWAADMLARRTGTAPEIFDWVARGLAAAIVIAGLVVAGVYFKVGAWPAVLLLGLGAGLWFTDTLRRDVVRSGFAVAAIQVVGAGGVAALRLGDDRAFAIGAAAVALIACAAGFSWRRISGLGTWWSLTAAAAGTASTAYLAVCVWLTVVLKHEACFARLALVLALCAAAWALAAAASRHTWVGLAAGICLVFSVYSLYSHLDVTPWIAVAVSLATSALALMPLVLTDSAARRRPVARVFAASGLVMLVAFVVVQWMVRFGFWVEGTWMLAGDHAVATVLLGMGAYVLVAGALERFDWSVYAGFAIVLLSYWVFASTFERATVEWFTTPLALYFVWAGWWWARSRPEREAPAVADIASVAVGLGAPTVLAALPHASPEPWTHLVWALGIALVAIGAGVAFKVRAYFFGGIASVVLLALVRTWVYLMQFWWLVLGMIGVTMLVVALTWERQRVTRQRIGDTFEGWR